MCRRFVFIVLLASLGNQCAISRSDCDTEDVLCDDLALLYFLRFLPVFVVGGSNAEIYTSNDGLNYSGPSGFGVGTYNAGAFANNRFVLVSSSAPQKIGAAQAGVSWSTVDRPTGFSPSGIVGAFGLVIMVGDSGNEKIFTSVDGLNLTDRSPSPTGAILTGVAYGNGVAITVSDVSTQYRSSDGINWSGPFATPSDFTRISFGLGRFVGIDSSRDAYVSVDGGNSWSGPSATGFTIGLTDLIFDGGYFVGTSTNGDIRISPDGLNWTPVLTGASPLRNLAHGRGATIAVGDAGTVYYSTDRLNWSLLPAVGSLQLSQAVFGAPLF